LIISLKVVFCGKGFDADRWPAVIFSYCFFSVWSP